MDFIDQIRDLASNVSKQIKHIQTEEATKSALIMPFIKALGYNVFDPTEVIPEFTADIGTRKGEKVDYAILQDGKPIMLFECKWSGNELDDSHLSQLFRYFSVTDARIGVLTNGIIYRFYSDLESPNKMDTKPFLVFNIFDIQESQINELKKLTKSSFDLNEVLSTASDLKYTREMKKILAQQLTEPTDDFIRFLGAQVYPRRMTQQAKDQFSVIVKRAFNQFVSEQINTRLKSALAEPAPMPVETAPEQEQELEPDLEEDGERQVETTVDEIEGFYIVKSILRGSVDPIRIAHRDTLSYMGVLLDDNNRKPICRLRFNNPERRIIELFREGQKSEKVPIKDLNDIYNYGDILKSIVAYYDRN